jgi:hypothetical protein
MGELKIFLKIKKAIKKRGNFKGLILIEEAMIKKRGIRWENLTR